MISVEIKDKYKFNEILTAGLFIVLAVALLVATNAYFTISKTTKDVELLTIQFADGIMWSFGIFVQINIMLALWGIKDEMSYWRFKHDKKKRGKK